MSFESTPVAQHSLPHAVLHAQQISDRIIDDKGETIVFGATLLREQFVEYVRFNLLPGRGICGILLECICLPWTSRQARKVADSWRLYLTEETLCYYLVDRSLYGCSFPLVSVAGNIFIDILLHQPGSDIPSKMEEEIETCMD